MAEEAAVRVGLLWYDDRGTLGERLVRAREYYAKKYGVEANWALVNGGDWAEGEYGIAVERASNILPFHIWIGYDEHLG